jgi:dihydroxy-acid dehydratase
MSRLPGRTKPRVDNPVNPYRDNVQGKANEPITVAGLLDRSRMLVGGPEPDWSLDEIYDRLETNAPRIAVIGGSSDHPAHVVDPWTVARAALRIWQEGGVPFYFSVPVLCDGTAQDNMGMCYSLQSRNQAAGMVLNQMEAHSYHGAFVIQGCDKTPLAIVSALAHLDTLRRTRGEAPVWATFAPAHVLKGGAIPDDLREELDGLARQAERAGCADIAYDIRDAAAYILQCSSNTAFQGVMTRAVEKGILTRQQHKEIEKRLAVNTCDSKGGICAFNGTGNSSRHFVSGLGLVHPALELLTDPPTDYQVGLAIADFFRVVNRPECGVRELVRQNIANAIRIHSASGQSTNLIMHMVGAMIYAGYKFSLHDVERIHRAHPVPDLFDYSLTQGRDIFALAQQCCSGQIRGMETLMYELGNCGVPMDLEAWTVTGTTWRERLSDPLNLSASGVKENQVILSQPRRSFSGVDVLQGNWFESAVVKISGMPDKQLDEFDRQVAVVVYFNSENDATDNLLNPDMTDGLRDRRIVSKETLRAVWRHNGRLLGLHGGDGGPVASLPYGELWDEMVRTGGLKIAIVIAGAGPEAYGMPEMFTPMQHINASQKMKKLAALIADGRYSGVSYGAAIGHVTPEAFRGGNILRLADGDLLLLELRERRLDLLDPEAFAAGELIPSTAQLAGRDALAADRMLLMRRRQKRIAASNRLVDCTDAAHGVVPRLVWEEAELQWQRGESQ